MNVVDSSGWLEYLADGPNADFFAKSIITTADLVVPTLSLYEVFKRVLQQRGEDDALQAVALMQQATIVELSASLALSAARISLNEKIPMADSIILATARAYGATLWSQITARACDPEPPWACLKEIDSPVLACQCLIKARLNSL